MLQYPIFITDDPDAEILIPSLPGQKRCASLALHPSVPIGIKLIRFSFLPGGASTVSKVSLLPSSKRVSAP
jgi:hypothetical protein